MTGRELRGSRRSQIPAQAALLNMSTLALKMAATLCVLCVALPAGVARTTASPAPVKYFVDCGADHNGDGGSLNSPWANLDSVNSHSFNPGDEILFKRGSTCHGTLMPKGSGTEVAPVWMTAYGEGVRPQIVAGSGSEEALRLFNQEYWDIDSLELSGGNTFGVFISGDKGVLHHIHLANLLVHDVGGAEMKHKESGLVVISPGSVDQRFDDVIVDGVIAYNTQEWVGILVGGGNFGWPPESTWSTHVDVRNSTVHDVQGDGIVLFRVREGSISSSVAWNTGMQQTESMGTPNAIWTWMCRDCVVEQSEAFLTDSPGVDGGAFDIDYGTTNNSVVDSYGHDTQGYCIAVFAAGYTTFNGVVRGNTCLNNGRSPRLAQYQGAIFVHTWNNGKIDGLVVEDNTVYWNPPGTAPAIINDGLFEGEGVFRNNRIISDSPWMVSSNRSLRFDRNKYSLFSLDGKTEGEWKYGDRLYATFAELQSGGQETGGDFHRLAGGFDKAFAVEQDALDLDATYSDMLSTPLALIDGKKLRLAGNWTILAELSAKMQSNGMCDEDCLRQLTMVRSVSTQFRPNGLRTVIAFRDRPQDAPAKEALDNLIRDLNFAGAQFATVPATNGPNIDKPLVLLISPEGHVVQAWHAFASAAEMGIAVRRRLGNPDYSKIGGVR